MLQAHDGIIKVINCRLSGDLLKAWGPGRAGISGKSTFSLMHLSQLISLVVTIKYLPRE